jgi:dephospho-CoA kinase
MSPKPVIGLVGGIGAGKSLVAQLFAARGGLIVSGDEIAHEALRDPKLRARIVETFGSGILGPDGEIVRKKLAGPVFSHASHRQALEAIVFPWIGAKAAEKIEAARRDPETRFVVLDAAVMFEAGWNNVCDRVVYVHAPREARVARLRQRGWSPEQITAREQAQWPLTEKARRADAAVDNSGSAEQVARQLDELLTQWRLA